MRLAVLLAIVAVKVVLNKKNTDDKVIKLTKRYEDTDKEEVIELLENNLKAKIYLENPEIKTKLFKNNVDLEDYNSINNFMEQEEEKIEYQYDIIPREIKLVIN